MAEVVQFKPSRNWSEEQLNTILGVLAVSNGALDDSLEELAGLGIEIAKQPLTALKKTHAERYIAIVTELQPKLQAQRAEQLAEVVQLAHQREVEILGALDVSEMTQKDLGNTLRNVSTSKGIALQHHNNLTGHAPIVKDTRNVTEMLRSIAKDFKGIVTITESIEIHPEDPQDFNKANEEVE